jgi:PTS system N-acetylglucosamine-specific IIC component
VLTGVAMALMDMLSVKLGFGFSAGLFDYLLGYGKATRPLLLLPVGVIYGVIYYFGFRVVITRFGLKTPGRDASTAGAPENEVAPASNKGHAFIAALGGARNIRTVQACTTRLRLIVEDQADVDEHALRVLGARGMIRPSDHALQVVLGPSADQTASQIRRALGEHAGSAERPVDTASEIIFKQGDRAATHALPEALATALGGAANVAVTRMVPGRLIVEVIARDIVRNDELMAAAPRGFAWVAQDKLQVLV